MRITTLLVAAALFVPATAAVAAIPTRGRATETTRPKTTPDAPKPESETKPKPKTAKRIDLGKLPLGDALARMPTRKNPQALGLALTALRRFAGQATNRNAVDRSVARALKGNPKARKIASRIIARIDALPEVTRAKKIKAPSDTSPVDPATLRTSARAPIYDGMGMRAPHSLPAESIQPPPTFELRASGVRTIAAAEPDGDELLAIVTRVRADTTGFLVDTFALPPSGAIAGVTEGVSAVDQTLFESKQQLGLLTSVVFEVDGEDAALRDEFAVMLGLAKGLAEQLLEDDDNDKAKLARFAFALDYTIALLAVSDPAHWSANTLQKTVLDGQTSLLGLYGIPPQLDGSVMWKLAHEHALQSGHYKLYFDVPAPPVQLANLSVEVRRVEALNVVEANGADLRITVGLGNEELTKELRKNKNKHNLRWIVDRRMSPRTVPVHIRLEESVEPSYGTVIGPDGEEEVCGVSVGAPPCPGEWEPVEFGYHGEVSFDVDLVAGAIDHPDAHTGAPFVLEDDGGRVRLVVRIAQ